MKRLLFIVSFLFAMVFVASAGKTVVYSDSVLPVNAKSLLSRHFGSKVNHVKIDKNLLGKVDEYEVILQNGTEVDFEADGTLREVDAGKNAVPSGLLLQPIKDYVKKNCGNKKIVQLEIKKDSYKIELVDGRELKFDRAGKFLSVDV